MTSTAGRSPQRVLLQALNTVPAWGHIGQQSGCQNSLVSPRRSGDGRQLMLSEGNLGELKIERVCYERVTGNLEVIHLAV